MRSVSARRNEVIFLITVVIAPNDFLCINWKTSFSNRSKRTNDNTLMIQDANHIQLEHIFTTRKGSQLKVAAI